MVLSVNIYCSASWQFSAFVEICVQTVVITITRQTSKFSFKCRQDFTWFSLAQIAATESPFSARHPVNVHHVRAADLVKYRIVSAQLNWSVEVIPPVSPVMLFWVVTLEPDLVNPIPRPSVTDSLEEPLLFDQFAISWRESIIAIVFAIVLL